MTDAPNFPLPGSNDGSTIPGNLLGGSTSREQGSAAADAPSDSRPAAHPSEQPAANSTSSAAAKAARVLASEAAVRPPSDGCALSPDRRRRRRALISAPVRVRGVHIKESGPDEISTTIDISRGGILFVTHNKSFEPGMDVAITFPYCKAPGALHAEQHGIVARVHEISDGRFAVAIAIGQGVGEDLVDSCGWKLDEDAARVCTTRGSGSTKQLVLALEADETARKSLRNYLTNEGYDVIAVKNATEAREVLNQFIPALIIAEVEGEGLPGFELCVFVKSTEKLTKIPVLLTTRNGYPTDYSNAHSLGAVVCMAKPYKQERLGHVVRLLAPPPQDLAPNVPAPRPPDPSRRTFNGQGAKSAASNSGLRRFRFHSSR
jgi:CheY-like chemotaxis protein